jgi:hypothetical protein
MLDDSSYSTSHGSIRVQMAVNLEKNVPYFSESTIENKSHQQLKINLSNK